MRWFHLLAVALLLGVASPLPSAAHPRPDFNPFAAKACAARWYDARCVTVARGQTWEAIFPAPAQRSLAQKLNRQNVSLREGQWLLVPALGATLADYTPLPQHGFADAGTPTIVVSPHPDVLAWGLYEGGVLVRWGPAVGGKDYCPDVGRSCRTDVGSFRFLEAAGPKRRSNVYPEGCPYTKPCAPMPHFLRFTHAGQGLHGRDMHGANASHGCVGLAHDDAAFLNQWVRAAVGRGGYGYLTRQQVEASPRLVVLSYESLPPQHDLPTAMGMVMALPRS